MPGIAESRNLFIDVYERYYAFLETLEKNVISANSSFPGKHILFFAC